MKSLLHNLDIFTLFLLFASSSFLFLFIFNFLTKRSWRGLPPGPPNLPLLGSLPFLGGGDMRKPLRKMKEKYGEVFTVYLGTQRVVVLSSADVIKEAFIQKGQAFADRPDIYAFKDIQEFKGIVSASGDTWRKQRRFLQTFLREFTRKSFLEDKILEEVPHLLNDLALNEGQPLNPARLLNDALTNVIGSVVFGSRLNYDDPQFRGFVDLMNEHIELVKTGGILVIFPFLKHLPGDVFKLKRMQENVANIQKNLQSRLNDRKSQGASSYEPQDFVDAYLQALYKSEEDPQSTFSEGELVSVLTDLYTAGAETTANTLRWALAFLLHHPDILLCLHEEIDVTIGSSRSPTPQDRVRMPYTEATILEVQRRADVVPFGLTHSTASDVEIAGYYVPRGTMVMSNLCCVHRDEKYFPDPFRFDPTRFLGEDGKVKKCEHLMPFSVGCRVCVGEHLARLELFLLLTSILQRYTISLPEGDPLPDLTGTVVLTNVPPDFSLIFSKRA